jgi:hypothetical protein
MNPKTTLSGTLKNYHQYVLSQTISKNPQIYCIHSSLPKSTKSCFGFLRTLGIENDFLNEVKNYYKKSSFPMSLFFNQLQKNKKFK